MLELPHDVTGLALNLEADNVGVVLFGEWDKIVEGDTVKRTGRLLEIPVGESLLGRIVDPLGRPLDDKGEVNTSETRPAEFKAPGVVERQPVDDPRADRAQGDRRDDPDRPRPARADHRRPPDRQVRDRDRHDHQQQGQGPDLRLRRRSASGCRPWSRSREILDENGAIENTIIVAAPADEAAPIKFMAPYAGCAMAEHFLYEGKHALVHLRRPHQARVGVPRRCRCCCAAPRAARPIRATSSTCTRGCSSGPSSLNDDLGGGSLTALPIIETQANDVSAYIPTNVISITDGQIFLESRPLLLGRAAGDQRRHLGLAGGRQRADEGDEEGRRQAARSTSRSTASSRRSPSSAPSSTPRPRSSWPRRAPGRDAEPERAQPAVGRRRRWRRSTPAPAATSTGSRSSASHEFLEQTCSSRLHSENVGPDGPDRRDRRALRRGRGGAGQGDRRDGRRLRPRLRRGGPAARGGRVRPGQVRGGAREAAAAPTRRPRPRTSRAARRPRTDGRGRGRGGRKLSRASAHGHPEGSQEPHRARSRTSRRSRGRWRWSRRRGCGAPSSASTTLRPYAQAIRKMTQQRRRGAPAASRGSPLLEEREDEKRVAILLVTGDRGLAGAFNTQIIRAGLRLEARVRGRGRRGRLLGRRPARRLEPEVPRRAGRRAPTSASPTGPAFTDAREIGDDADRRLRRRGARPRRADLQPLRLAADPVRAPPDAAAAAAGRGLRRGLPEPEEPRGPRARRGPREGVLGLRARARGAAADAVRGLRGPLGLPGAARVDGFGARARG